MAEKTNQMAFDLPLAAGMGREDFFVTPANRDAFALLDDWPGESERRNILVLVGPAGSGKSHLAEIWRTRTAALRADAGRIKTDILPRLLSCGNLVVEDAPGADLDERAMFHLFNMAKETRAGVLLTSQIFPARWQVGLADLESRLKGALVAEIGRPDDELLRAVLVKLFSDRQLLVRENTISYMLTHMERSLAAARDLVAMIDQRALREKAPVSRSFVARIMKEPGE